MYITYLEGKDSSVLAISKRVYECLAHEEPDCNAYGHGNHCTSNIDAISVRGDSTCV